MVSRGKHAKYSSGARDLLGRISAESDSEKQWKILFSADEALFREINDSVWSPRRSELLREFANLHDSGLVRFRKRWSKSFREVPPEEIMKTRDELRRVWDQGTSATDKQAVLERWSEWKPRSFQGLRYRPWVPLLAAGRVIAETHSLHGQLSQAVMEKFEHLARCQNPNCPAPYFLARRRDQRYCEQGECTKYGQREFALDWWNRKGKKRRQQKIAKAQASKKRSGL
jgi:hypothetical protein